MISRKFQYYLGTRGKINFLRMKIGQPVSDALYVNDLAILENHTMHRLCNRQQMSVTGICFKCHCEKPIIKIGSNIIKSLFDMYM